MKAVRVPRMDVLVFWSSWFRKTVGLVGTRILVVGKTCMRANWTKGLEARVDDSTVSSLATHLAETRHRHPDLPQLPWLLKDSPSQMLACCVQAGHQHSSE